MFNYFKILLALTLLVTPFSDRLIDVTTMGGTYIIGCICKNGIVIGADSRTSWLDNSGNVVAYDDLTKKVFTFNNIVFTRAGSSSFADANLTFNGVFKKFQRSNQKDVTVDNFHMKLFSFAKTILSQNDYKKLTFNSQFIVGGYLKNVPHLYFYHGNNEDSITTPDYRQNGASDLGRSVHHDMQALLINDDVKQTINLVDSIIQNIIKDRNKVGVGNVGGVSSICAIENQKSKSIKNNIVDNYSKPSEYLNDILKKRIKIKFPSNLDSLSFYNSLKVQVKH